MKTQSMNDLNTRILEEFPNERLILGHGNLNSKIVLIGEAPGGKEVELGQPFVGQAGKHFNEFLEILEIDREDVYITNVVKYRPSRKNPKTGRLSNRTPTVKEIDRFKGYLHREISIINPELVVTLGNTPLKAVLDRDVRIGDLHGNLIEEDIGDNRFNIFPLYHPAAVIYRRELKVVYMEDLENFKKILKDI